MQSAVAVITYVDESYALAEGDRLTFGRDDSAVDMPIWEAINSNELSRVAGEVWCEDGEIWVRNLSSAHDLQLLVPLQPPLDPLPPRLAGERGSARSVPAPEAWVCGPGGCRLHVARTAATPVRDDMLAGDTLRPPRLPERLEPVAAALCEPLLAGESLPATYTRVAERLGVARMTAIRRVGELVELYQAYIPGLQARLERTRTKDEPVLLDGQWVFPVASQPATPVTGAAELPLYHDVAVLLVRQRLVRPERGPGAPADAGRRPT